jgi:hypothetical protein
MGDPESNIRAVLSDDLKVQFLLNLGKETWDISPDISKKVVMEFVENQDIPPVSQETVRAYLISDAFKHVKYISTPSFEVTDEQTGALQKLLDAVAFSQDELFNTMGVDSQAKIITVDYEGVAYTNFSWPVYWLVRLVAAMSEEREDIMSLELTRQFGPVIGLIGDNGRTTVREELLQVIRGEEYRNIMYDLLAEVLADIKAGRSRKKE